MIETAVSSKLTACHRSIAAKIRFGCNGKPYDRAMQEVFHAQDEVWTGLRQSVDGRSN